MKSRDKLLRFLMLAALIFSSLSLSSCGYSESDLAAAKQRGYEQGYNDGYHSGVFSGYEEGYDVGYEEGYFNGLLDDDTEATEPAGGWPTIKKDK